MSYRERKRECLLFLSLEKYTLTAEIARVVFHQISYSAESAESWFCYQCTCIIKMFKFRHIYHFSSKRKLYLDRHCVSGALLSSDEGSLDGIDSFVTETCHFDVCSDLNTKDENVRKCASFFVFWIISSVLTYFDVCFSKEMLMFLLFFSVS